MTSCHLLDLDFSYLLAVAPFFPATFLIPSSEKLPHFQPARLFLFFETVTHPRRRLDAFLVLLAQSVQSHPRYLWFPRGFDILRRHSRSLSFSLRDSPIDPCPWCEASPSAVSPLTKLSLSLFRPPAHSPRPGETAVLTLAQSAAAGHRYQINQELSLRSGLRQPLRSCNT